MSETFYGPDFTLLSKQDPDIAAVLLSELKRQQTNLQLIASENFTSRAVLAALGSTLSNKYAAEGWGVYVRERTHLRARAPASARAGSTRARAAARTERHGSDDARDDVVDVSEVAPRLAVAV